MSIYGPSSEPPGEKDRRSSAANRDSLKAEIKRRVQWLSNDCSTFWRVRLELTEWCTKNASTDSQPSGLGGGNFIMALAMLSACNFLAKAHAFLVRPEAFVSAVDRAKVKEAKAAIKQQCPELKSLFKSRKTDWIPLPIGSCNEMEAFERLIEALHRDGIDLGLPTREAQAVWGLFRNELAHMAHPQGVVEVCAANDGKPVNDARGAILGSVPAFRMKDGRWVCNADRLSLDVVVIADWLCKKVDDCTEPERIRRMVEWVFEETDLTPAQDPDDHNE